MRCLALSRSLRWKLIAFLTCLGLLSMFCPRKDGTHFDDFEIEGVLKNFSSIDAEDSERVFDHLEALKYVRRNVCHHRPLNEWRRRDVQFELKEQNSRFAYVWYITNVNYLCSAIVTLERIKILRQSSMFPWSIDYVLIYDDKDLSDPLAKSLLQRWFDIGGIKVRRPSFRGFLSHPYYKSCYDKFHSFALMKYDRIIAMDADGIVLHNLDHLFLLKFPNGVSLAAPQGYWFKNSGIDQTNLEACPSNGLLRKKEWFSLVSSSFMVIEPNATLFARARQYFGKFRSERGHHYLDMEILNVEFGCKGDILVLPSVYATLDVEFTLDATADKVTDPSCLDFNLIHYFHFTYQGKPWSKPELNTILRYLNYPEKIKTFFKNWFQQANSVCPDLIPKLALTT